MKRDISDEYISFCTSFSGVSWAKTTGTSEKHLVTDWETTSENYAPTNAKVKTAISYGRDGKANEFGYRANKRACRWFKLLLQREEIHNSSDLKIIEETRELLKTINKTVDDAITDYLRWIWQRADQNLRQYADPYYEKTYGLKVVLTVPAAWKPRAKDRTLQAAKRAGIPADIELVAEPEAAALFVLRSMREDETLQVGCNLSNIISFKDFLLVIRTNQPGSCKGICFKRHLIIFKNHLLVGKMS